MILLTIRRRKIIIKPFEMFWKMIVQLIINSSKIMKSGQQKRGKKQLSLQDFQIEYKLGEGAQGYVFLASRNNEEFAIKQLNKGKLKRQHREYQPLVQKEVLRVLKHPGIIKTYSAFQNTNSLYLVLEYCSESQLQSLIKNNLLTERARRFYCAELVNIIQYLHTHGIIHRDLKPANLLLSREGHLKMIDFGTADISNSDLFSEPFKQRISQMKKKKKEDDVKTLSDRVALKKKSTFVGTTQFLSPELIQHSYCVPASDLWALGCIIYFLYYGHGPFKQSSQFQSYQFIKNGKMQYPKNQSIPNQAIDLMQKLLIKQPEKRLGSCSYQQLSFYALKNHPFFSGINVDSVFQIQPPEIQTPQSQVQQKLMQLRLQANLSYKQPAFDNLLEKMLVKIDEYNEGIYLCHFKKQMCLYEYKTLQTNDPGDLPTIYHLLKDNQNKFAHLLSETKFSVGIKEGQRLIYSSKDSKAICKLLNEYYSTTIVSENK